jgi:oxalate decarboxylase
MRSFTIAAVSLLAHALSAVALPAAQHVEKRAGYDNGQPSDSNGKGAPLLGGTQTMTHNLRYLTYTQS